MDDALQGRDESQDGDQIDRFGQQAEDQAENDQADALRPRSDADRARDPEFPGSGSSVADQKRTEERNHSNGGVKSRAIASEQVADGGEDDAFRSAIDGGIQKGSKARGGACGSSQHAVHQIRNARDEEDQSRCRQLIGDDQTGGDRAQRQAGARYVIRADAQETQPCGKRIQPRFYPAAEHLSEPFQSVWRPAQTVAAVKSVSFVHAHENTVCTANLSTRLPAPGAANRWTERRSRWGTDGEKRIARPDAP